MSGTDMSPIQYLIYQLLRFKNILSSPTRLNYNVVRVRWSEMSFPNVTKELSLGMTDGAHLYDKSMAMKESMRAMYLQK